MKIFAHFLLILFYLSEIYSVSPIPGYKCPPGDVAAGCKGPIDCLYPNPDDCSTFIQCRASGDAYVRPCAVGKQWNDHDKRCDYPQYATCNSNGNTATKTTSKPLPCTCQYWLGDLCGTRVSNPDLLKGACAHNGLYECKAAHKPANLKGYCPNCVQGSQPGLDSCQAVTPPKPEPCMCQYHLGDLCGTRVKDEILTGNCDPKGFYQCKYKLQPPIFKGYCPYCTHAEHPGMDECGVAFYNKN